MSGVRICTKIEDRRHSVRDPVGPQDVRRILTLDQCVVVNEKQYSAVEDWPFINYLDTGSITEGHIDRVQRLTSATDKIPSRARRKCRAGDIVYSTVRPNQRHYGIIKQPPDNLLVSTGFAVIRAKETIADTGYIYRYLTQNHIVEYLQALAEHSTSAYPSIRPADLAQLEIALPSLDEQRRIADVLGALDDRIELNRRMCKTLEEMAQALYKAWFVDFEPVLAKMEGRWREGESLPGLPAEVYRLFPDELVDSQLGPIPAGWQITRLGALAHLIRGRSYRSQELRESDTALVTLKSFARGGGYRSDGLKPYAGSYAPEQLVHAGEVILACTDVTQDAEVIGRPAVVAPAAKYDSLVASLDVMIVRPRRAMNVSGALVLQLLSTHACKGYLLGHTNGTTVLHLDRAAVGEYQFAMPGPPLLRKINGLLTGPIDQSTESRRSQADLVSIRDTLLPKLISGEIQIDAAEEMALC